MLMVFARALGRLPLRNRYVCDGRLCQYGRLELSNSAVVNLRVIICTLGFRALPAQAARASEVPVLDGYPAHEMGEKMTHSARGVPEHVSCSAAAQRPARPVGYMISIYIYNTHVHRHRDL